MAEQVIDYHWYASGSMRGQVQPFQYRRGDHDCRLLPWLIFMTADS